MKKNGPEGSSSSFLFHGEDRDRRFNTKRALTLLMCVLALTACNIVSRNNEVLASETPTLTPSPSETLTPTPSATLTPSPTLDYVESYEDNLATREAKWDATREVEPYGSVEWAEKLSTFPSWYSDAIIGMTGSTTIRKSDGLWVYWYQCNGAAVSKTLVRGADGGKYVVLSSVTNEHCSFDQFNANNSSPLRLSLRGVDSFDESFSTFMTSTILTESNGTQPIDMALVTVLASVNPVTEQIIPMGIDKFIPSDVLNATEEKKVRGVGIPWSNSHSFSFFSGFMGAIEDNGNYFPTYDINSVPGLSGTLPLFESSDVSGIPGVVSSSRMNATNLSFILGNPENIQEQLTEAQDAHMKYLESLGYIPIP